MQVLNKIGVVFNSEKETMISFFTVKGRSSHYLKKVHSVQVSFVFNSSFAKGKLYTELSLFSG